MCILMELHAPSVHGRFIVGGYLSIHLSSIYLSSVYISIFYLSIPIFYLSIYLYSCCSHLEHRASVKRFVSLNFLNFRQSVGLLERVISPSQGRYLHTNRIYAGKHPCLELDSNPRSQTSSERRHFMSQTARQLWSAWVDNRGLLRDRIADFLFPTTCRGRNQVFK
jgi:hypothetical protein